MEGKWKREEEERVGSPALLHLACSHNTKWIGYLSVPSFLHFSLLLLHVISLSLSLSLSVTFLFHVNRCNGRQMEAGSRKTSQFPGSSALSLLSQYQVDCVPFRTFVLTFLASSSSSCHLCLFLSLYVTFLFHVNRCKWKANGSGKKKNESVPRLSCT